MTYKPLMQNHIQQTLSLEDFHAKTSAQEVKAKVLPKKLGQVFFTNSSESFAWFDLNTSSWKTWQRSLITDWELYSESWPSQGSIVNGLAYQRVHWEPVIREIDGSLLLPTPNTLDYLQPRKPEAMSKVVKQRQGRKLPSNLREAINPYSVKIFQELQENGNQPDLCSTQTGDNILLNEEFVETMMGFPVGYTEIPE